MDTEQKSQSAKYDRQLRYVTFKILTYSLDFGESKGKEPLWKAKSASSHANQLELKL